jgi:thymidine phosphorylase
MAKIGEKVTKGQPLLTIHANDEERLRKALDLLSNAFRISAKPVRTPRLILETIR